MIVTVPFLLLQFFNIWLTVLHIKLCLSARIQEKEGEREEVWEGEGKENSNNTQNRSKYIQYYTICIMQISASDMHVCIALWFSA